MRRLRRFASLVALLATGCGPVVLWRGVSPGGQLDVEVLAGGGGQRVRVDGADQVRYRDIGLKELVFSADGRHLAYPARGEDGWVVVRDGRAGPPWDGIGTIVLSADGAHCAYAALRDKRWSVVFDGHSAGSWEALLEGSLAFDPGGQHFVYGARNAGGVTVVIDERAGPVYEGVASILRIEGHVAYLARRGDRAFPVVDGAELGSFDSIAELAIAPTREGALRHAYLARRADGWHAVIDGVEGPPWTSVRGLRFSSEGAHVAFVARSGHSQSVVLDGVAGASYEHVDGALAFVPGGTEGERLVYRIRQRGRANVVWEGKPGPSYRWLDAPVVAGAHWGYVGRNRGTAVVAIDGQPGTTWDWAGDLVLDEHGHHAFLAERNKADLVVHDGVAVLVGGAVADTLVLGNGGRSWGCLSMDSAARAFRIVVDGSNRRSVAFGDLVDLLGPRTTAEPLKLTSDPESLRALVVRAVGSPSAGKGMAAAEIVPPR